MNIMMKFDWINHRDDTIPDLDHGCARCCDYSISSADRPAGWLAPIVYKMYVIDFKYVALFWIGRNAFEEIRGRPTMLSVGEGVATLADASDWREASICTIDAVSLHCPASGFSIRPRTFIGVSCISS